MMAHMRNGKLIHRMLTGHGKNRQRNFRPDICMTCEMELLQACERLLKVEKEVLKMDSQSREWFFGKEGHRDTFLVARAMKAILKQGL